MAAWRLPTNQVGRMVLNRNPENYFAEVEQAAFSPGNFVPGIATSPDKMLQGRLFAYHDAHRYRLGPNYHLLPVNRPKAMTMENYQRDGSMRFDGNEGGKPNYYPNSFGGPEPLVDAAEPPLMYQELQRVRNILIPMMISYNREISLEKS